MTILLDEIRRFLLERGALKVGVATAETLAGGPPSADLTYKLPSARAAVTFALPMNREHIRSFLAKRDRSAHEQDNLDTNLRAGQLSWELAEWLQTRGYQARGTSANLKYRQEIPGWQLSMPPDISHRYLAVASGVGSFGWSGNVGIKGHGAAIILGTCLTDAPLEPTPPETEDERFCTECKLCARSCAGRMFSDSETTTVELGPLRFTHAARHDTNICLMICGGFSGLSRDGKWSTWSPGRFRLPETKEELLSEFMRSMGQYGQRPPMPGGYRHSAFQGQTQYMTCGNCQIVCGADKAETAQNLKTLHNSGCVLQDEDGNLRVLPAAESQRAFAELAPEHRAKYE